MLRDWPEIVGSFGGLGVGRRVLGPSLDELGDSLRRLTARRLQNVGRVVKKANALTEGQPDEASPNLRAAFSIFREAMVAEDEVVADYLGGVLASARVDGGDDAVAWTALIARMSSRELRTHYKLYAAVRQVGLGHTDLNLLDAPGRERLRSFIPYLEALKPLNELELMKFPFALTGLAREGLFDGSWRFGALGPKGEDAGPGVEFAPSLTGLNLFTWGNGLGDLSRFLEDRDLQPLEGIEVPLAVPLRPFEDVSDEPQSEAPEADRA